MDFIRAIILGIVEGLTEFLPISSTGHLILVNHWISFSSDFTPVFDVVIQVGAILAVVVYFWRKLFPFGKSHVERHQAILTWKKTLIGVLPAILVGGLFGGMISRSLFNPLVVALALLIGGVVLIVVDRWYRRPRVDSIHKLTYKMAFGIGLIQCFAMIPGTSRSAATIIGAMLLGASRFVAVEFSFFLAVPTLIAASAYSLLKHHELFTGAQIELLAVGFVTSFIVALAVIAGFMNYISRKDLKVFGWYRIVLALIVLGCIGL